MKYLFCFILLSYLSFYPNESNNAFNFIEERKDTIDRELNYLNKEEKILAISIIAPELSQFSHIFNEIEMRTLYVIYLNSGKSDFSVGYFQMKPNFIEKMEQYIKKYKFLKRKYIDLLPSGSKREKRRFRLNNLSDFESQLRYLSLFIEICKLKTKNLYFKDNLEELKYWATLYNSGLELSPSEVIRQQKKKQFPKFLKKFNYSSVSAEFYNYLKNHGW